MQALKLAARLADARGEPYGARVGTCKNAAMEVVPLASRLAYARVEPHGTRLGACINADGYLPRHTDINVTTTTPPG